MFSVDEELPQHVSFPIDDAEMCLMTPPRHHMSDTFQWTPTANLKLLVKAASPDLHSREMSHSHSSVHEVTQSKANVTVSDVNVANDCGMQSGFDMLTSEVTSGNATVSVDKRRRKDKSLGLLCER